MSYHACMSNCRDPKNRSKRKMCVCGGHNHKNVKKNKHHHSTASRWKIRVERRHKQDKKIFSMRCFSKEEEMIYNRNLNRLFKKVSKYVSTKEVPPESYQAVCEDFWKLLS